MFAVGYEPFQTCRDGACAYQFHLHSATPYMWFLQATDPSTDPTSPEFVRCAHSCRSPELVYQDCLDTGLDGCAINHHSGDFGRGNVRDWVKGGSDVHEDLCGGEFERHPEGFVLEYAGGHSDSDWDYLIDRANLFMAENPEFLALAETEWTVSSRGETPSDAPRAAGHKVSVCSRPMKPHCAPWIGDGNQCPTEADLFEVARGEFTLYPPSEPPQRCALTWAHPCGQGNASKAYLGPLNEETGGGSDYQVLSGYAIRPRANGQQCLTPDETSAQEAEWVGLPWMGTLDRGIWAAPVSDADFHHYTGWGPNICRRNEVFYGGARDRTYCYVTENTGDGLVDARDARRCYYAQGRVRLETRAWSGTSAAPSRPADAILGGGIYDATGITIEILVERIDAMSIVELDELELWHNGAVLERCGGDSGATCFCDGERCFLRRSYSGGIDGWLAILVHDREADDGRSSVEVAASVLRVNWDRFSPFESCPDGDDDGLCDSDDPCPAFPSGSTADSDGNGIGDECECGDASGDGRVRSIDARLIQRCTVGLIPCPELCDADGDDDCDAIDARLVQRAAVGLLSPADLACTRRP